MVVNSSKLWLAKGDAKFPFSHVIEATRQIKHFMKVEWQAGKHIIKIVLVDELLKCSLNWQNVIQKFILIKCKPFSAR